MTTTRRLQTRQRSAVWAALQDSSDFTSAQQLHARLRESGDGVGLATVYRTLQALAEDGALDVVRNVDGEVLYRRCSTGHHHHLTCRRCRRTVEVDSAAVERWAREVGNEHGFGDVEHVIEVFGTCRDCAEGSQAG
ncbi:MAG: transcriptional repressor [Kineosporiaceae bacterium]|nr:transcriptional repressor [Kineosporiaceae bacterium]MBK7621811.1 transcriptional repressor [Kineosporiaceae bacterium]